MDRETRESQDADPALHVFIELSSISDGLDMNVSLIHDNEMNGGMNGRGIF